MLVNGAHHIAARRDHHAAGDDDGKGRFQIHPRPDLGALRAYLIHQIEREMRALIHPEIGCFSGFDASRGSGTLVSDGCAATRAETRAVKIPGGSAWSSIDLSCLLSS